LCFSGSTSNYKQQRRLVLYALVDYVGIAAYFSLPSIALPLTLPIKISTMAEPTPQMSKLSLQGNTAAAAAAAPKGTAKRDALCAAELEVQAMWEREKVFECNPSSAHEEKFIVTFPYPYSNGHLHLGHAFSLTKAVFRAQFERNRGKNSLFPFAFHCTGMPIQAVSACVVYIKCFAFGWACCNESAGGFHAILLLPLSQ
jgi:hypothetical protein